METAVRPSGMLLIKIKHTETRNNDYLPQIIAKMSHRKKLNFTEQQISINLHLHLYEKGEKMESAVYKGFSG